LWISRLPAISQLTHSKSFIKNSGYNEFFRPVLCLIGADCNKPFQLYASSDKLNSYGREGNLEMLNRKKILLVDDDPAVTDYLRLKLSKLYTVEVTNKPTDVLSLAVQERPDLILCDIDMPGMDGGDVARALSTNERTRRIPILFLTSIISHEEAQALRGQVGGRPGMSKHSPIDEILSRIRTALGD
jgi:CheY-like chemotaxis protein